jgi:hypothetical protein
MIDGRKQKFKFVFRARYIFWSLFYIHDLKKAFQQKQVE